MPDKKVKTQQTKGKVRKEEREGGKPRVHKTGWKRAAGEELKTNAQRKRKTISSRQKEQLPKGKKNRKQNTKTPIKSAKEPKNFGPAAKKEGKKGSGRATSKNRGENKTKKNQEEKQAVKGLRENRSKPRKISKGTT